MEFIITVPLSKTQVLIDRRVSGTGETLTFYIDTKLFRICHLYYSFSNFSSVNNVSLKVYSEFGRKRFLLKEITTSSDLTGIELINFVAERLYFELQAFTDVDIFVGVKLFV